MNPLHYRQVASRETASGPERSGGREEHGRSAPAGDVQHDAVAGHIVLHADVEMIPVAIEDSAGPLGTEIVPAFRSANTRPTACRHRHRPARHDHRSLLRPKAAPSPSSWMMRLLRPGWNARLSIIAKSHVPTTKSCNSGTALFAVCLCDRAVSHAHDFAPIVNRPSSLPVLFPHQRTIP